MFLDLKQTLAGTDSKLDQLTDRMDHLKDRVDDHDSRLNQLERGTSDLDDGRHTPDEQLMQMEEVVIWEVYLVKHHGILRTLRKDLTKLEHQLGDLERRYYASGDVTLAANARGTLNLYDEAAHREVCYLGRTVQAR
ncbi:hypothetical protein NDU88_003662 [Pleurodeles waltl]|uniref:t-SNARE coiled-coil homology domain-containing protein n=1 Tax=Pleurodeles waltl TaxID=8319 RepID=A0AAV7TQ87_PLEWA|nr:hypothetical protein NDU88_003662 [Pleurodeles waltl]